MRHLHLFLLCTLSVIIPTSANNKHATKGDPFSRPDAWVYGPSKPLGSFTSPEPVVATRDGCQQAEESALSVWKKVQLYVLHSNCTIQQVVFAPHVFQEFEDLKPTSALQDGLNACLASIKRGDAHPPTKTWIFPDGRTQVTDTRFLPQDAVGYVGTTCTGKRSSLLSLGKRLVSYLQFFDAPQALSSVLAQRPTASTPAASTGHGLATSISP